MPICCSAGLSRFPVRGRAAEEGIAEAAEVLREAQASRSLEQALRLRVQRVDQPPVGVEEQHPLSVAGAVGGDALGHAADPLLDLDVAAGVAEVVEVLHGQGNELPPVGVGGELGQRLVHPGEEHPLVIVAKLSVPGRAFRGVPDDFIVEAGGHPHAVPGVEVDLVDGAVGEHDHGQQRGKLLRLAEGVLGRAAQEQPVLHAGGVADVHGHGAHLVDLPIHAQSRGAGLLAQGDQRLAAHPGGLQRDQRCCQREEGDQYDDGIGAEQGAANGFLLHAEPPCRPGMPRLKIYMELDKINHSISKRQNL